MLMFTSSYRTSNCPFLKIFSFIFSYSWFHENSFFSVQSFQFSCTLSIYPTVHSKLRQPFLGNTWYLMLMFTSSYRPSNCLFLKIISFIFSYSWFHETIPSVYSHFMNPQYTVSWGNRNTYYFHVDVYFVWPFIQIFRSDDNIFHLQLQLV